MAGIVTGASSGSVCELAASVTHGDYSGQTENPSPTLTPDPGEFGGTRSTAQSAGRAVYLLQGE